MPIESLHSFNSRTGKRTTHTKGFFMGKADGGNIVGIGSRNADNRSGALNSEVLAMVHGDKDLAGKTEAMIIEDMNPKVVKEITLKDIGHLPPETEARNFLTYVLGGLML